jgi:hypothetical protein
VRAMPSCCNNGKKNSNSTKISLFIAIVLILFIGISTIINNSGNENQDNITEVSSEIESLD